MKKGKVAMNFDLVDIHLTWYWYQDAADPSRLLNWERSVT